MALIDPLGYAKHLQNAGVDARQAEAHAEAVRDFVMKDLATTRDLETATARLEAAIAAQSDKMTIRLGAMLFALVAAGTAALRFLL